MLYLNTVSLFPHHSPCNRAISCINTDSYHSSVPAVCYLLPKQLLLCSPALSLGFTNFGSHFCICDRFFFYPTIYLDSHILSLWIVHAGCVFVVSIHPSRTWMSGSFESMRCESMRWNARVHRLNLGLDSSEKEFGGNGVRIHVNSKGKIPSPNSYWNELSGWGPHDSVCNQDIWDTVGAKTLKKKKLKKRMNSRPPDTHSFPSGVVSAACLPWRRSPASHCWMLHRHLLPQPGILQHQHKTLPTCIITDHHTGYPATQLCSSSHLSLYRSSHHISITKALLFIPVSLQISSHLYHQNLYHQRFTLHTCLITDLLFTPVSYQILSSNLYHCRSSLHTCTGLLFTPVSLQIFWQLIPQHSIT